MPLLKRQVNVPLWSVVVLFLIAAGMSVAAYFAAVHSYQANQASQRKQAAQQAAAQKAAAELYERRLCTSLGQLAALQPPAGPSSDLSRVYLLHQHQVLAGLGPDVGCGSPKR